MARSQITIRIADTGIAQVEVDGHTLDVELRRHARGWRIETVGNAGDGPGRAAINAAMADAADDLAAVAQAMRRFRLPEQG